MRKVEKLKYTKNLEKWGCGNNRKLMAGGKEGRDGRTGRITVSEKNGGGSDPENEEGSGDKDEKRDRKSERDSSSVSRRDGRARRL
jgi:hypothetical protein